MQDIASQMHKWREEYTEKRQQTAGQEVERVDGVGESVNDSCGCSHDAKSQLAEGKLLKPQGYISSISRAATDDRHGGDRQSRLTRAVPGSTGEQTTPVVNAREDQNVSTDTASLRNNRASSVRQRAVRCQGRTSRDPPDQRGGRPADSPKP